MTTALVVIAIVLLVIHWRGPNAVWGTATMGIVVGIIISLIFGDWGLLALSFGWGTIAGTVFEWIGRLTERFRR